MTMSGSQPDGAEIERLLREAGSAYDPPALHALIEGVLAAPAEVGTSWHMLVADPVTPALADALEARRAAKAKGYHTGLAAEDFARLPRPARIDLLRRELAAKGLNGFIVPRADEHQGEYVPLRGQRLAWLTGFTGSPDWRSSCAIVQHCLSTAGTPCRRRHRSTREYSKSIT